jgi:hypothetical protein
MIPRRSYVTILLPLLAARVWLFASRMAARGRPDQEKAMTVTVGPEDADFVGMDQIAIQQAIDQVARAGGGVVTLKAGTYIVENAVRLASHVTLAGEGSERTIIRKAPGVRSQLKIDADYGESQATVEAPEGFRPGMGLMVVDDRHRSAWYPSLRTLVRVAGSVLYFDRILHLDYLAEKGGLVATTFPLISGAEIENAEVRDLTADGNRSQAEPLDGCQTAAIYFYRSQRFRIRNCQARHYAGDGISAQFVEDPLIENCEAYGNAHYGIHLGTGALRATVRHNRAHHNDQVGLFLCWRVQSGRFTHNQLWGNGEYGISLGHKDTDNTFEHNSIAGNGHAGVYFRNETPANAAHRNTFPENTIEDNGGAVEGAGVRVEAATQHLVFRGNTLRETRPPERVRQTVGIYLGPQTDHIVVERNIFSGPLKQAIADESQGAHNQLQEVTPK